MSAVVTSAQEIVKSFQAREESTEGTFIDATDGAGAVAYVDKYALLPPVQRYAIKNDLGHRDVGALGTEDVIAISASHRIGELSLEMKINDAQKGFLKYLVNAANVTSPSGTISKSLSIFFSKRVNGTETYYKMAGCRCTRATISCREGEDWTVSADFIFLSLTVTTTGLATASVVTTAPSGAVWNFVDGGTTPFTWNAISYPCKEFTCTWERNTNADWVLGNTNAYSSRPHARRIGGTVTLLKTSLTPYTDFNADTARSMSIVMKTGQYTLSYTNVKLTSFEETGEIEETQSTVEPFGFKAVGFTDLA